ncbi:MAG TPA: tetratricopeptide repeat protein [Bacteroidales bacterium]|nr:tetratricopeptide repeat protein [Bacteroidales bacterium]
MTRLSFAMIFFIYASLQVLPGFSQTLAEQESMLSQMPPDTSKVNLLIRLGEYHCGSDFEKALLYLQQALVLSTEISYKHGIAQSYLLQGRAYYYKDDYPLAINYLEKSRKMFEALDDEAGLASYYLASGHIKQIKGNLLHAMQDFQKGVELSKLTGKRELEGFAYNSLGSLSLSRSENDLALQYFKESLAIAEEISDEGFIANQLTNIGRVYENRGLLDSALYYMNQGLEIRTSLNHIRGMASSGLVIGNLLIKMERYQDAVEILNKSQSMYTGLNDDTGISLALKRKAMALNYLGKSNQAFSDAENALFLARKIKNPSLISDIYSTLAEMMAHNGDYENAYNNTLLHNRLKDSLANANKENILSELEIQFQSARKDDQISMLKQQNQIQRKNNFLLLVSLSALLAILVLILILFRLKSQGMMKQQKLHEQENTIRQQESQLKEKEQQMLKEDLEARNREMASKALEMLRVNETIESIIEKLENFRDSNSQDEELVHSLRGIVSELESQVKNNSWNEFESIFNNIHSKFFTKLLETCPNLTPSEIKIAALLRLNLNTKEIAALTYKSEPGIKSTRFRLRKKLGLNSDDSLVPYLIQL